MSQSTDVDFGAYYQVDGFRGVAFYLDGWAAAYYDEDGEPVESDRFVRAYMVGDDREHVIDKDDLIPLPEDGFCHGCGQTGCGHG